MAAPLIRLEAYWQGSYLYNGKNSITSVEIKQNQCMKFCLLLLGKINKKLQAEEEQALSFTVKQLGSAYHRRKKIYQYKQFDCPSDLVKELQIFVNVLKRASKNPPRLENDSEKPKIHQRRGQTDQIVVPVQEIPELEPNTIYQLKITHLEGKLQAAIVKKVEVAVAPYLMQEEDPPVGVQEIDEKDEEKDLYTHEKEVDLCAYLCSFF